MRPHLRYLRYVLLHKLYVARAMVAIRPPAGVTWTLWLWRALVHDLSKFRPSEWRPYVEKFYGDPQAWLARDVAARLASPNVVVRLTAKSEAGARMGERRAAIGRAFDRAWLAHQHRNPHHWQHWLLREDDGKTKVLLMPVEYVDEMVADWLGAGTKVLRWPSFAECIAETIAWYVATAPTRVLRHEAKLRAELLLATLAEAYGVTGTALEARRQATAAELLTIPGR
jgi:hypothetical protein